MGGSSTGANRARGWAVVLVIAVAVYLLLAGARGWALITSGDPVAIALGLSVLAIPVVGAWVVWREVAFGAAMQRMGERLAAEGDLPEELPRTASGRYDRDAADTAFEGERARVEAQPHDWRGWYRLALAYDAARDRRRAREAMREARRLFDTHP